MGFFIRQFLPARLLFNEPAPATVVRAVKEHRASAIICVPHELSLLRAYTANRFQPVDLEKPVAKGVRGLLQRWWRYRAVHRKFGWKFWAFICGGASLPE